MNESPAAVRQGRWGWGTPLKETTTTGRDRCVKAGPPGQARSVYCLQVGSLAGLLVEIFSIGGYIEG